MHNVKFLTYFGIYIANICYIISQYMLNRSTFKFYIISKWTTFNVFYVFKHNE